jgi:N6-adenosine-specific RNA methylase IME4
MKPHRTKVVLPLAVASLDELLRRELRFPTIYCDPPWQYEFTASHAAAENHYRTMPIDDIVALPVAELASRNAHLHLWATSSFLREAFTIMDAWGFTYKSGLVWIKD